MKIDKIDLKILEILQKRGRITNALLAQEIGLSPAPTLERVRKLENGGFIQSFHALVNAEKLGLHIIVFIEVKLSYHSNVKIEEFTKTISAIDEVVEAYHITGDSDFLLKMYSPSIAEYQKFMVGKLSGLEGIGHIRSKVVLSTIKKDLSMPLDHVPMKSGSNGRSNS